MSQQPSYLAKNDDLKQPLGKSLEQHPSRYDLRYRTLIESFHPSLDEYCSKIPSRMFHPNYHLQHHSYKEFILVILQHDRPQE